MADTVVYPIERGSLVVLKGVDLPGGGGEFAKQLAETVGHNEFLVLWIGEGSAAEVIAPDELKARLKEALG